MCQGENIHLSICCQHGHQLSYGGSTLVGPPTVAVCRSSWIALLQLAMGPRLTRSWRLSSSRRASCRCETSALREAWPPLSHALHFVEPPRWGLYWLQCRRFSSGRKSCIPKGLYDICPLLYQSLLKL